MKPVRRKQKANSRSIRHPNAAITRTPLDLQRIAEVFNEETADDPITDISAHHHPLSASEDLNYPLDIATLPLTPTLPRPKNRKRPAHVLGKQGGAMHPKRLKRNEGLLPSDLDIDVISSGESPVLSLSTPLRSLPLVTQPIMVSAPLMQSDPPH